ncbi:mas-related G-protein coupled receptor member X2-like [Tenrec ecaudatus]|uniref:mas-related G-protein coupled receptor member X2-like n=1 Tax=Tenrec ecaudatus TaxID=94439 RepID=UPI003F59062E
MAISPDFTLYLSDPNSENKEVSSGEHLTSGYANSPLAARRMEESQPLRGSTVGWDLLEVMGGLQSVKEKDMKLSLGNFDDSIPDFGRYSTTGWHESWSKFPSLLELQVPFSVNWRDSQYLVHGALKKMNNGNTRTTSGEFMSMEPTIPDWEDGFYIMNESDPFSFPGDNMMMQTMSFLTVTIALGGLAGNAIVVWLLGFCLRRNPFSVYFLHLALANCLALCVLTVSNLMELFQFFPRVFDYLTILKIMIELLYLLDMSLLSAIGTERCLCVLCPDWYRCRRPGYVSASMCSLLWALFVALTTLHVKYCMVSWDWCPSLILFLSVWNIFLFVVLCASSLVLLVTVFCGSQKRKPTRLTVTILITVLVCLLCSLPLDIHWFPMHWMSFKSYFLLYRLLDFLSCVNSSANPIIYFFVGSFRQQQQPKASFRMVLQRALQDTPEGDEPGGAPPQGPPEWAESVV